MQIPTDGKPLVVLVVEDEFLIRLDAIDYLSGRDIVSLEAVNADQAMEILAGRRDIDVLFTDVNMPGTMDGLELAKRVRELSPLMGIIVTSGMVHADSESLPERVEFFEKPYDLHRIGDCIRHLGHAI